MFWPCFKPLGAGALGVVVYQSGIMTFAGKLTGKIGGDGGFSTAALCIENQNTMRLLNVRYSHYRCLTHKIWLFRVIDWHNSLRSDSTWPKLKRKNVNSNDACCT